MNNKRILIADEDLNVRLQLSQLLSGMGYLVRTTSSAATVLNWLKRDAADLAILEACGDAQLAIVGDIHRARPELPILLTCNQTTLAQTVKAVRAGAVELLAKPVQTRSLLAAMEMALACAHDPDAARAQARAIRDERLTFVGAAASLQPIYRALARLVEPNLPVLIWGESGVGKTIAAKALHDFGPRADAPFIRLTLGAASDDVLARELLGDEQSPGKFALAQGGTLFFDGVDDLSWAAQGQLLHLLEQAAAQRGAQDARTGIRLVASARQDLRSSVDDGVFREDLYFRLAAAAVRLPPLRERLEDIPDLARALLLRASRDGLPAKKIDAGAIERLQVHRWPGNVRELDNLMRRLCALHTDELITMQAVEREMPTADASVDEPPSASLSELVHQRISTYFASQPLSTVPPGLYDAVIETVERPLLQVVLAATRGNQVQAAEILGINRNTLRRKVQDLRLETGRASRRVAAVVANDVTEDEPAAAFSF